MAEAPFWNRGELDSWAREQRSRMVLHAFEKVPYYRDALSHIRLDRLTHDEEWRKIPTIDKSLIVAQGARMTADGASGVWTSTSGSTGRPLRILLDRNVNAAAFALFWRAWGTGGYWSLGKRQAVMKGTLANGLMKFNWPIRALEVVSAHINSRTVREVRDGLAHFQPQFMRGYPSSMFLFCGLLEEANLDLHIPMIVTGSEMLYEYHRSKFESVFGARVINHYTHWERAASILECEHGQMHAQEDYGHHELLDPQGNPVGPGQVGEITVTGLHNRAMPLVRYRTGDMGVWSTEACSCGRSFPAIEQILGRQVDFLIRKDGILLAGLAATRFSRRVSGVRYAQLVQYEPGKVVAKVVRMNDYKEATTHTIMNELDLVFDGQMDVRVEFCGIEDLERNPVGKIRLYINRIPQEHRPRIFAEAARTQVPEATRRRTKYATASMRMAQPTLTP